MFQYLAQLPDQIESFPGTAQGELLPNVMTIINGLLIFVGLAAAVFIVIGGVQYVSSSEPSDQDKAKKTVLYAALGLVVVGVSAAIVNFVVGAIQGQGQFQQSNPGQVIQEGLR